MVTFISRSPEDTQELGAQWGRSAVPGLVIGLSGELGAGKTQLVKGIAHGLGSPAKVHSPTFVLLHEYTGGRLPLFHLDLYRLDTPSQIISAGLETYFYTPPGVAVVEWIERLLGEVQNAKSKVQCLAGPYRQVWIELSGETERRISYEDFGP